MEKHSVFLALWEIGHRVSMISSYVVFNVVLVCALRKITYIF